ncbi:putative reverse transcriptase domain-containing protein [Tanacetum coccineum]
MLVTAALPLPPSLYISPPADHRGEIPESKQPPRKRLCLSTLGSRYKVGESSTARPTKGRGIDYRFVSTVDSEERRQGIRDVGYGIRDTWVDPAEAVPEIAPMTVGEVNTKVIELAELHEHDTQDLYALLKDAQDSRSRISQRVDMDSQRVDLLMGDRMTLQETVWMVEEEAYASREAWAHSIGLSQATHQELQTHRDHVYAHETHLHAHQTQLQLQSTLIQTQYQVYETRFQMQQAELAALRETDRRRQAQMVETLWVIRDIRREMSDMQAELLHCKSSRGELDSQDQRLGFQITRMLLEMLTVTSSDLCYFILLDNYFIQIMAPTTRRGPNTPVNNTNPNNMTPESIQAMIDQALLRNSTNGDGSHSSHEDNRRNVQTARPCFYADFMKCQPLNFKGTEGVVGLTRWIEKMESVFNISGCAIENQVKFATCTLLGAALTWWNGQIRTLGPEAYAMTWEVLKKKMTDKYCPQGEIKKLEIELWNLKVKGNDVPAYTERFQELTLICTKFVANETEKVDKYISGLPDNIYGNVKSARPKTLDETIELANDLMDQKLRTYAERQSDNKRKADDSSSSRKTMVTRNKPFKRGRIVTEGVLVIQMLLILKGKWGAPQGKMVILSVVAPGHISRVTCPKLKNRMGGYGMHKAGFLQLGMQKKERKCIGETLIAHVVDGCTMFTDHKSLQHILDQKELNMRQRRWLELLSDYDYDMSITWGKAKASGECSFDAVRKRIERICRIEAGKEKSRNEDEGWLAPVLCVHCVDGRKDVRSLSGWAMKVGKAQSDGCAGDVASDWELPQELSSVHHTFHVSNLKRCYADEPLVMPLEGIHVDDKLKFMEEPMKLWNGRSNGC